MYILRIVLMMIYMILVPYILGISFGKNLDESKLYKKAIYTYIVGFFVMLALYTVVEVTLMICRVRFDISCVVFSVVSLVLCTMIFVWEQCKLRENLKLGIHDFKIPRLTIFEFMYLLISLGLLIYQLYHTIFFEINYWSYDDEFYVAWPNEALHYNEAFAGQAIPTKRLFQMHLFFPAFLSKMSGIHVATVMHTILPPLYLLMAYGVIFLLACRWIGKREDRWIFMIFVQLIYIWLLFALFYNF